MNRFTDLHICRSMLIINYRNKKPKEKITMAELKQTRTFSRNITVYRVVMCALMAALVYVGNYLQIKIPNGVFITRIHFGNSMCLLAGLLFGSLTGGLASGIGAMLYDLFDPVYIISAPYTFLSKFAMGFAAGLLNRYLHGTLPGKETFTAYVSAIIGQIIYIILYLLKTYCAVTIPGGTPEAAWTAVGGNALTSSVNAAIAVLVSVPLYFALKKALSNNVTGELIAENDAVGEKKLNIPLIISAVLFIATLAGGILIAVLLKK